MNQADILKLAEEARVDYFIDSDTVVTNLSAIFRFAELVAQHEIAEILEMVAALPELNTSNYNHDDVCDLNSKVCNLVLAIRERGAK